MGRAGGPISIVAPERARGRFFDDVARKHLPLAFGHFDGGNASVTETDVNSHAEGLLSRHDVWRGGP